ncbi:hypothetical protein Clacol_009882 [Clathrus columnatus]|uniref:Uncharacterized protein n=1 Tax=Clathrus columnatus TaxID=1419009 RepID=A0AAV5AR22_9AGAM|nr:hypothetical protein Clacol_009882 [Clathrus columnatus]
MASFPLLCQSGSDHHTPRLFIGPMLVATVKKAVLQGDGPRKHWWSRIRQFEGQSNEDEGELEEEAVPDIEAFRFYMFQGGREEEWASETLRNRVKRDMIKILQQNGWVNLFRRKNIQTFSRKWVGGTFVIGQDFLGIPLEQPSSMNLDDIPQVSLQVGSKPNETFVALKNSGDSALRNSNTSIISAPSINNASPESDNSTTALVPSPSHRPLLPASDTSIKAHPSTPPRLKSPISAPSSPLRPALHHRSDNLDSGIGKSVQSAHPVGPASPRRVLNRAPDAVPHTSAEASQQNAQAQEAGDMIRRERMLIRQGYTKSGHVGRYFGETEASKLRDLRNYEWKEFLVVWRKHQLELYEDYACSMPGKERLWGHKHLARVIPLEPTKTRVSLYSFIDLSFCLTCTELADIPGKHRAYGSITKQIPFLRSTGTHIFVFKTKIRTSGIDWLWDLWKELGDDLPHFLEIHCPLAESYVKLRIPERGTQTQNSILFTKEAVIERCHKGLKVLPSWEFLIEQRLEKGASLQLCWRNEAVLDWVQWETDLSGKIRDASVLYGLCLKRPHEQTRLELRIGEHCPNYVMKDDQEFIEPSPIEGYVYRIKLKTDGRVQIYLSVHSGCLFFISPTGAHPPRPPLPITEETPRNTFNDQNDLSFREEEKRRAHAALGAWQLLQSNAFVDLRKVATVQRTLHPGRHRVTDDVDIGGDEGFKKHPDRTILRLQRSFDLLMQNGRMYRFETYSCSIAQQWVDSLHKLIDFWTRRHRADAAQEMEIIAAFAKRKHIYHSLSAFQPLVVKPGDISQDLALVTGHIIQFDIISSGQNSRSSTISLLDAYICSGHFATQSLSVNEFSTFQPPVPRRFQDGLEIEDHELDLVFLIWYRSHAPRKTLKDGAEAAIPAINAKHNIIVCKARSKLERDSWCWAINYEIERTVRHHASRELRSREGGLVALR